MKFVINGGKKLEGTIRVSGAKNAATPIIAATLLTDTPVTLENIPRIGDVETLLQILKSMGSTYEWLGEHTLRIVNANINPDNIDQHLVRKIRSSILLVGPLLSRFGKAKLSFPGGCHIGARPIDTHLMALRDAGVEYAFNQEDGYYEFHFSESEQDTILLQEFSVTATENMLMLGTKHGLTIRLAALEPHVSDTAIFLTKLGYEVQGMGTHTLRVLPLQGKQASEIRHRIIPDDIEAGTFAILAAATRSTITIEGIVPESLDAVLIKLRQMGVVLDVEKDRLTVRGSESNLKAAKIDARIYPGIPSDLQAPFGVLATQAEGTSVIFDTLYEGRLQYIGELKKMGVEATILDPHRALVHGPAVLHGTTMQSLDLRAGATLVIAALVAREESIIEEAEQIDRGYEKLDERLRALGADIVRD
ncbi:MAG: UDP-N-acetylglucosamine 1-carboxyvinyltransferase [Patescibacteria group bacterium]